MKKIGVSAFMLFLVLVSTLIVSAANVTSTPASTDKVEKAYTCLKDLIEDKDNCKNLNSEEQAFSLLAMAHDTSTKSKCKTELMAKSKDDECWPKDNCNLKQTSLALLALNNINTGTGKIENWLLKQNSTASDLIWYLEIDITTSEQSTCTITYDASPHLVTVKADKKITGTPGSCLSTENSYWLKISTNCYDKSFSISCDKDFITTLLYKKKDSNTVYVSNKVSSAASSGMTEEKISASCFKQGNSCNYEGSLWATLALSKAGEDIKEFLPYLIALSEDNQKYFPSTILYIIAGYDEYLADIVSKQKPGKFWQADNSPYNKFYDTSLALLALQSSTEADNAKDYLLSVQNTEGCWQNSVRDTAFILYSGWPKTPISDGGISVTRCEDYEDHDYHCTSSVECDEAEGETLENFYCSGSKVCCNKPAIQKTCAEKLGKECLSGETCSTGFVSASDTNKCCLAECRVPSTPEENECEKNENYYCRSECLSNEEEKTDLSDSCEIGDKCCIPKIGGGGFLIWLLIILIILVILAIIFRNKLRVLLFKLKSGARKGPAPATTRPGFPPRPPFPPGQFRPVARPFYPRPTPASVKPTKPVSKSTDKEMEETFKKLKEMSK